MGVDCRFQALKPNPNLRQTVKDPNVPDCRHGFHSRQLRSYLLNVEMAIPSDFYCRVELRSFESTGFKSLYLRDRRGEDNVYVYT